MGKVYVHEVEKKPGYLERLCELEGFHNAPLRMDNEDFMELGTEWVSEPGLHISIEKAALDLKKDEFLDYDSIVFLVRIW